MSSWIQNADGNTQITTWSDALILIGNKSLDNYKRYFHRRLPSSISCLARLNNSSAFCLMRRLLFSSSPFSAYSATLLSSFSKPATMEDRKVSVGA